MELLNRKINAKIKQKYKRKVSVKRQKSWCVYVGLLMGENNAS